MTLTEQAKKLNGKIEGIVETAMMMSLKGSIKDIDPAELKAIKDTLDMLEEMLALNAALCSKIDDIDGKIDFIVKKQ